MRRPLLILSFLAVFQKTSLASDWTKLPLKFGDISIKEVEEKGIKYIATSGIPDDQIKLMEKIPEHKNIAKVSIDKQTGIVKYETDLKDYETIQEFFNKAVIISKCNFKLEGGIFTYFMV